MCFTLGEGALEVDAFGLGVSTALTGLLLAFPSFFPSGDFGLGDLAFLLRSFAVDIESPRFFSCSNFHAFSELWPTKLSVI